jgi:hypothetical protein
MKENTTVFKALVTIPKNRKKQEDFIKQIVEEVLVNPVMTIDQSPKQQHDDSRDRLDAACSEQRRDRFNKNRPISQEIFSPTQNIPQSQLQSQPSAPFTTQPSPAKPNPFQKSAEDRSAFLLAISRSPSPEVLKINNKIKILNVNKLKLFLQNDETEESQTFLDYNFNDNSSDKPHTRARAKLIKYKEAAQLALLMLNEEGGSSEFETIDSLCSEPCPSCYTEMTIFIKSTQAQFLAEMEQL